MSYANGPKIVTDGLVLCLDAANRKSYPLSGSTIYDLSGNGYHGTIYNNLPFSENNNGYFDFNNTNTDWHIQGSKPSPALDSDASIEIFFYTYSIGTFCLYNQGRSGTTFSHGILLTGSGGVAFRNTNGDYTLSPGMSYSSGTWTHVCFASTSTGTSGYKNGQLIGTTNNQVRSNSYNQYVIGRRAYNDNTERLNGRVSLVRVYHKQLSANEVQQNYNALKGRYGLT